MPEKNRRYLISEKQVRLTVLLGSVGMAFTILALFFLATSRPQGKFVILDGEVEISAERTQKSLSVKVRDNGVGLGEGKVGTGLGTQIVRTLIQGELGGTIDWHTVMGSGTEVTIDVPMTWLNKNDDAGS